MTKLEFLAAIDKALAPLTAADRQQAVNYYDELLHDMIEDGMNEAAATAHLGNPNELARGILEQFPNVPAIPESKADAREDHTDGFWGSLFTSLSRAKDELSNLKIETEKFFDGSKKEFAVRFDTADRYASTESMQAQGIRNINVNWISGTVIISADSFTDTIRFSERSRRLLAENERMQVWTEGDTLYIRAFAPGNHINPPTKHLELYLPENLANALGTLELKTVSADATIDHLHMQAFKYATVSGNLEQDEMESISAVTSALQSVSGDISLFGHFRSMTIDTTSGDVSLNGGVDEVKIKTVSGDLDAELNVRALEFSTISGDAELRGACEELRCKAVSGDICAEFDTGPKQLEIVTTSGDVELTVPEGSDYTLTFRTSSGDLDSEPDYRKEGRGTYYCGTGRKAWSVKTTSGDLTLQETGVIPNEFCFEQGKMPAN